MNICFLNSEKYWGGGEKWHFKMAQLFQKNGDNVFICTNISSELGVRAREHNLNVKEFNIGRYTFINPIMLKKISGFFTENSIDVVIMNNPLDLKIGVIAGKAAGVKNLIYRRGMPHPIRNTSFNRWLFGNLRYVIAISEEVKRSILVNNPKMIEEEKILLYYNSIDKFDYEPLDKKPGDILVFGTTGRLVEQKGQHHLIEAARILADKNLDFKIKIAGKGPLEEDLNKQIYANGLTDKIELTGFIKKLDPFLNSIDIFVFPSYFEGSAVSIVEAIYFGKPVIAYNISTMPELVKDGFNGFLAEFKNSADFADKMEYFIKNKDEIMRMGTNAKSLRNFYDLEDVFFRLREVLIKSVD